MAKAKLRWYLSRSEVLARDKNEAMQIANRLRKSKRYHAVRVVRRVLGGHPPKLSGWWIKVISKR